MSDQWTGKTAKQRWKTVLHNCREAIDDDGYFDRMGFSCLLLGDGFPIGVVERIELFDNHPIDGGGKQLIIPRVWKNAVMALLEERE